MRIPTILHITVLAILSIQFSSCEKENTQLCDPTPVFDVDTFINNVNQVLENETNQIAGYQFVVNQDGNLYYSKAKGFARYKDDQGGEQLITENTYINVASVSKFIATIALMQVLKNKELSVDDPIHPHLPERWRNAMHNGYKVKPDINDLGNGQSHYLTFRKIMQMRTGIPFPPPQNGGRNPGQMPTTDEMLAGLTLPGVDSLIGTYQNGNFTLIRVLISEMVYRLNAGVGVYNLNTANAYLTYIKENIFDKIQINNPLLSVNAINNHINNNLQIWAYQYPFTPTFSDTLGNIGWPADNTPEDNGGSGGLMLNALELAKILAYFKHDNTGLIIDETSRKIILDNQLGLLESFENKFGTLQSKGGTRGADGWNRAIRSRIIFFPNGVEAALIVNCDYTTLGSLLATSYENAWIINCQ